MNKIKLIVKKNNNGWFWVISNGYGLTWVWMFLGMSIKWVWVFLGMDVKWPNCTYPFGCGPPNLTLVTIFSFFVFCCKYLRSSRSIVFSACRIFSQLRRFRLIPFSGYLYSVADLLFALAIVLQFLSFCFSSLCKLLFRSTMEALILFAGYALFYFEIGINLCSVSQAKFPCW